MAFIAARTVPWPRGGEGESAQERLHLLVACDLARYALWCQIYDAHQWAPVLVERIGPRGPVSSRHQRDACDIIMIIMKSFHDKGMAKATWLISCTAAVALR